MTISPERLDQLIRQNLGIINRLDAHLGCAICRGPLTDGRCPTCQGDALGAPDAPVAPSGPYGDPFFDALHDALGAPRPTKEGSA